MAAVFALWTVAGMLQKPVFVGVYHELMGSVAAVDVIDIVAHGARLDFAVAGYLTALPATLLIALALCRGQRAGIILRRIFTAYTIVAALAFVVAFVANIMLYGYWGFPLDSTPLFYLTTPKDAMASATWWQMLLGLLLIISLTAAITILMLRIWRHVPSAHDLPMGRRLAASGILALATVALFIPIRGDFTVATNNVGTVFFSKNMKVNHAAVNPLFSFIESVTHAEDFAAQYRFMDDATAQRITNGMIYTAMRHDQSITDSIISRKPDHVVIIVLESFSKYIMTASGNIQKATGGQAVTPTLDSLAHHSIFFSNIYANSFRTDRGLVAILSGYPAQPTTSLMKYPAKTNNIYSLAHSMAKAGYGAQYIYGGDANFTNMRSYLAATGFTTIISQDDFQQSELSDKWGANDGALFNKALTMTTGSAYSGRKTLTVIQTSSSHEPFDVPISVFADKPLNAFHYTDSKLGHYLNALSKTPEWQNTLVVIVPDHLGCYPADIDNFSIYRYQIPMFMTGGVIRQPREITTLASQHDIPATLLALLGIDHSEYTFSKDILDPQAPHFAFFTVPDAMGIVTAEGAIIYDNTSNSIALQRPSSQTPANTPVNTPVTLLNMSKAYLQCLYDDLDKR